MIGGGLAVLVALTWWGEPARSGPQVWQSIAASSALFGSLALVGWWLFLSPLPAGARPGARTNAAIRQLMALLATASGALFVAGATWSQAWGILANTVAAGAETWRRPELLILASGTAAVLAALTALIFVARGAGGLRQRFRADPLVGVLGLVAAYAALTMLAGSVWPQGDDMTRAAQGLPHLLAALTVVLLMLAAAAVQVSVLPWPATWASRRLGLREIHVVVQLAIATTILLLAVGGARFPEANPPGQAFPARPAWLYPALLLATGIFAGNVALELLRRPGAALLVMLAVLCYRALVLATSPAGGTDAGSPAAAEFLLLLPAAGLDLIYYFRQQTADERQTWLLANLTGVTLMLTLGLVLLPRLLPELPVSERTIPLMVVAGVLAGLWAGWVGEAVGAALSRSQRPPP
jgi:branched-subunit amino acid transport protein AzlD